MSISFVTSFCCCIWFYFEKVMDNVLCKYQNLFFFYASAWYSEPAAHLSLRLFYPLKYKIIVTTVLVPSSDIITLITNTGDLDTSALWFFSIKFLYYHLSFVLLLNHFYIFNLKGCWVYIRHSRKVLIAWSELYLYEDLPSLPGI